MDVRYIEIQVVGTISSSVGLFSFMSRVCANALSATADGRSPQSGVTRTRAKIYKVLHLFLERPCHLCAMQRTRDHGTDWWDIIKPFLVRTPKKFVRASCVATQATPRSVPPIVMIVSYDYYDCHIGISYF